MNQPHPRVILPRPPSAFWASFRAQAAENPLRILLPEATDPRVLSAAAFLVQDRLAIPVLVGDPASVQQAAREAGRSLAGVEILDPTTDVSTPGYAAAVYEKRKSKGMTEDESRTFLKDPMWWAAWALRDGRAAGLVGGAVRTTADTVRAGFAALGVARGSDIVSGVFLMECPHATGGPRRLVLADAAVSPSPSPRALGAIALQAAHFYERFVRETACVAALSFSTLGSAEDDSVTRVREAIAHARKKNPDLRIEGEWQADAALVDHIAAQKGVPAGPAAGRANVLIFPDLNSGNIGYKLVQHLGGARAVGPFLLGLAKPMADLSRGCTDEDIVDTVAITALMARSDRERS